MIALFARADHPEGWGFPKGRAHGYVVIAVHVPTEDELLRVERRLREQPFHGIEGNLYQEGNLREWYGGRFDLLATIPNADPYVPVEDIEIRGAGGAVVESRFRSFGDNRFFGVYDASEIESSSEAPPTLDEREQLRRAGLMDALHREAGRRMASISEWLTENQRRVLDEGHLIAPEDLTPE